MIMEKALSDYCKSVKIKRMGGGSTSLTISSSVVNKFNFPYFFQETELYNTKRTHFFLSLRQKECVLFAFKRIFRFRDFPKGRFNA